MTVAEELKKLPWQELFGNNVPDDDDDLDVWKAFSAPAPIVHKQEHFHQAIDELPEVLQIIAKSLVHNGVVIWSGIPEHIVDELEHAGYKISKNKKSAKRGGQV